MAILRGQQHPSAKLTEEQVLIIRDLWRMGHRNIKVIAQNNKVSPSNVLKIVQRKTWTHLNQFWSGSL